MDLRIQISLMAAVVSAALSGSILLRSRKRYDHWLFALFSLNVGFWYLTISFSELLAESFWTRANFVFGILLPLSAIQFFRVVVRDKTKIMQRINRAALVCALLLLVATPTDFYQHLIVRTSVLIYVSIFFIASLAMLFFLARSANSKFEEGRIYFLTIVGGLAAFFTLLEYLPSLGLETPPVGTILVLIFLYMLHQLVLRLRLIDLYELAGRLGVLTALSFVLASVLLVLAYLGGDRSFLHAVVASLIVLVLFDPLRTKVRTQIGQLLFRERFDLDQHVQTIRRELAHVLEADELASVLMSGIERSRRATHASLYIAEEGLRRYDRVGFVGPEPVSRLEMAPARPLLDRLIVSGQVVLEKVERQLEQQRRAGEEREAETLREITQIMDAMQSSICLALQSQQGDLYGILSLKDERMRDAFSPEEIALLRGLATQASISFENSQLYQRLKERDRLAALGEMAAGLAHEIRNPLGAIKASAQYLTEEVPTTPQVETTGDHEFLEIIVEEVDRLNRVVSGFLDYARPSKGNPAPTDVNATVERTIQFLRSEMREVDIHLELTSTISHVRIDVEQLRQVLINLIQNAIQAMSGKGELFITTLERKRANQHSVEVRVRDTGPGIRSDVLPHLFVPFVTTKQRGTGLGLAISQRIVAAVGGRILVRTVENEGTTFVVRLPASEERRSNESAEFARSLSD